MAGSHDMNELLVAGQLLKHLGGEMHPTIRNQKLQLGGQHCAQGRDDQLSGHLRPSDEQRHAQALARTVIGEHQDGDPAADGGRRGWSVRQSLALLAWSQYLFTSGRKLKP